MEVNVGDKIRIVRMEGEECYNGKEGIVTFIDDDGQIHGTWGGCALIIKCDSFLVIESDSSKN